MPTVDNASVPAMKNLSFRKATIGDANAIVTIVNAAYRGEASRKGWTTEADLLDGSRTDFGDIVVLLEAPDSLILLAELAGHDGTVIVGSVHLERAEEDAEIAAFLGMFAINPEYQANGLGKQMMQAAEALVQREWGARKILMDVISVRREMIAFYERRGYRLTGKVKPFPVNPDLWTAKAAKLELARMEKSLV